MYAFLSENRDALIASCKLKVFNRPRRAATDAQLANGVPLFLDQLTRMLEADEVVEPAQSLRSSGPAWGDMKIFSEIGVSATAHGKDLLKLGFTVDQVVYDYGDLSQALAELAHERHAPFTTEEFRTLNRCVDSAIAFAVAGFSSERDAVVRRQHHADAHERVGFLVHEIRNALSTATLAVSALELGNMTLSGATGAVLKRSLASLNTLITRSLVEVRSDVQAHQNHFTVAALMRDAEETAKLDAAVRGCTVRVVDVDPGMMLSGNQELLQAALGNLIQNALKFTHLNSEVAVQARAYGDQVLIEVEDHCGGLPAGSAQRMFSPCNQRNHDKSGLGLGLSIARQSIEAESGTLSVRDVPGIGCVFTISLPLA